MKIKFSNLEFENSALKSKRDNFRKEISLKAPMNFKCASKKCEVSFQEFITKNIDRSKITLMVYGISGKGKTSISYHKPNNFLLNPKPKNKFKKKREMHFHFIYGHSHYLYFSHKT